MDQIVGVSNFEFVREQPIRVRMDLTFQHILDLLSILSLETYSELQKSSFRKTIIISTASIIEGLLLYLLTQKKSEEECAQRRKKYRNVNEIYLLDDVRRIVWAEEVMETSDFSFSKINFHQITHLCSEMKFILPEMKKRLEKVRDLRNTQHIGNVDSVDREYSKEDLNFVFSVARDVKKIVQCQV
ncbi:MAG: hypothetical protein NUV81_01085 [bacterium]|nr:hypothetical protein [bacterium]